MFLYLVHDYTICFAGSPCFNISYYNYISISPYYIYSYSLSECSWATNVIGSLIVVDPFSYIRTDVTGKYLCLGCYHVNVYSTLMWC